MTKLVILISGRKQSGKNTLANQIAALVANTKADSQKSVAMNPRFTVTQRGELMVAGHGVTDVGPGTIASETWYAADLVKMISFATPLKKFCIEVLGLSHQQCWGTDADKNTFTHLNWDGLPPHVRRRYGQRSIWRLFARRLRKGAMTAREVMQVFGTDLMRAWYGDVWATACIAEAKSATQQIIIIPDARFPNELAAGLAEAGNLFTVKVVRMRRCITRDTHPSECALDGMNDSAFDLVVPPQVTVDSQWTYVKPILAVWVRASGVLSNYRAILP